MKPNYTPSIVFSVLAHVGLVALVVFGGFFSSLFFTEEKKKPTPKYINATLFDIKTTSTDVSPNNLAKQKADPVEKPIENKPDPEPEPKQEPDNSEQQAAIKKQELQKQQEQQKQEQQKQQKQKQEKEKQAKLKQQKVLEQAKLKAKKESEVKAAEAKKKAEAKKAIDAKKKADAKKAAQKEAQKEAQKKALQEKLKQSQKNNLSNKLRAEQSAKATQSYIGEIEQQFMRKWSKPSGAQEGIVAVLEIRFVPSGEVRGVTVIQSSGNSNFDESAVRAVKKAAPIAVIKQIPTDVFDRSFRSLKVRFNPW